LLGSDNSGRVHAWGDYERGVCMKAGRVKFFFSFCRSLFLGESHADQRTSADPTTLFVSFVSPRGFLSARDCTFSLPPMVVPSLPPTGFPPPLGSRLFRHVRFPLVLRVLVPHVSCFYAPFAGDAGGGRSLDLHPAPCDKISVFPSVGKIIAKADEHL